MQLAEDISRLYAQERVIVLVDERLDIKRGGVKRRFVVQPSFLTMALSPSEMQFALEFAVIADRLPISRACRRFR
jgi:hypothetical protein